MKGSKGYTTKSPMTNELACKRRAWIRAGWMTQMDDSCRRRAWTRAGWMTRMDDSDGRLCICIRDGALEECLLEQ